MSALLTALIAFVSAVVVAVLGHVFSLRRQRSDELSAFRLKAYVDFINSISRLVASRRMGQTEDELDELATLNDAKTRICICADVPVVEALSDFWERGATLEREGEIVAFTRLCMRMRESLGLARGDLFELNISGTLFKLQPSVYSYVKPSVAKDAKDSAPSSAGV